jgi:arabinofuranosyltransferase
LYSPGFFGFYAGIDCHIIDKLGLCDPLLSKLPCEIPWRIGHYRRKIPDGYKESLEMGINQIQHTALKEYYYNVMLITRGSLGSVKRLEAIWKMNIGQLKYLLNDYLNSNKVKN